jgi:hypothetical protein
MGAAIFEKAVGSPRLRNCMRVPLQRAESPPARGDRVWVSLIWMGRVELDLSESPSVIRLTRLGRRYPEPA